MWHRVDIVQTDVSEERIASIFKVEEKVVCERGTSMTRCLQRIFFFFFYP
jgi:hypothetical protein